MEFAVDDELKSLIIACQKEEWPEAAKILYSIWSDKCPKLYGTSTSHPWDVNFDEDNLHRYLLAPLASMYMLEPTILSENDNRVSLQRLVEKVGMKHSDRKPGQICGKVFKPGDPSYICKECVSDDTCVLCHECFIKSAHPKHRYKMHSSYGGGYCDCGDSEAFCKDFACQLHTAEKQPGDDELNFDANLPSEVKERIYNVTAIILKYVVTLVCWQENETLPKFLTPSKLSAEGWPEYKTVLFNDETHTYDSVISALEIATGCSNQQAMYLATIVDQEGRSVVLSNSFNVCKQVRETIQTRSRRDMNPRTEKSGPLEVKILTHDLCAHQTFGVKLLQWLTVQSQLHPAVASIIADVLMLECGIMCHLGSDLNESIPPPKPPRVLRSTRPKPEVEMVFNVEDAQFVIRGPGADDENIVINPIQFMEENLRQRHQSAVQPTARPPKLDKVYIKEPSNALPCGHNSPTVQLALFDRKLWKSARTNFHHLVMSTVLMDLEHKTNLGAFCIKNYESLYHDFIDDDHEYDVSIVSLLVQIFTVSSVAYNLMEKENALAIIFETIRHNCQTYVRQMGYNERFYRFDFTHSTFPAVLRRALYVFKDSNYILQGAPIQWSPRLIDSFINGFEMFVSFALNLQGMDAVRRQADQHQLIESEWETAFNIHVSMQESTTLLLSWAKTNPYVHQRAMKIVLDHIHLIAMCMEEFVNPIEAAIDEFSTEVVNFTVARGYVSVHQPLWRMIAGLLLAPNDILKYYKFGNKETQHGCVEINSSMDVLMKAGWENKIPINNLYIWPLYMLMEIPMRVLVLNSQCHAQLWRRNGFSLVNQIHNYTAPLCRQEMFDRDVQMMQIVAAKMDPTEFLIRFLDRFTLNKWASKIFDEMPLSRSLEGTPATPSSTPEELSKIVVTLAEEFLNYMIAIIAERWFPGVGKCTREEALSRDVIHLLCTGPKTFSAIEKAIVLEPTMKSIKRDEAVNTVAVFSRRNSTSAGTFKLKESYLEHYNAFYILYSKQQFSQAEQTQWREREKMPRHIQACPPPPLIEFEPFFEPILKFFESPLLIRILIQILERFSKRSRYSSEGLLHRGLFLIGMGLNEQIKMHEQGKDFKFLQKMDEAGIYDALKLLEGRKEVEPHHNLLWWVLKQYDLIKDKIAQKPVMEEVKMEVQAVDTSADKAAKRAALAQKKRQQALQMMEKMQKRFMVSTKEFSKNADGDLKQNDVESDEFAILADESGFPICLGPNRSKVMPPSTKCITCILCQEEEPLVYGGKVMVCCAFAQNSKLFTQDGPTVVRNFQDAMEVFTPSHMSTGYSVSTCSHVMHFSCFKVFSDALWNRDRSRNRMQMIGQQIIEQDHHEYLCPLCKRLSNCAMPLLPVLDDLKPVNRNSQSRSSNAGGFEVWLNKLTNESMKLSKKSGKDNAGIRNHRRKRSHSEISLVDLKKQDLHCQIPVLPQPLKNSNSPVSDSEASTSQRGSSEPVQSRQRTTQEEAIYAAARKTADYSVRNIFLDKLPPNVSSKAINNIPDSLKTFSTSIKIFLNHVSEVGPDANPKFSTLQTEVFRLFKCVAFVLRSTTATLKSEGKPLFGALNTRQNDCIVCLSRLATVGVLQLKTSSVRLAVARALTPLLIPLKDQTTASFTLENPEFMSSLVNTPMKHMMIDECIQATPKTNTNSSDSNPNDWQIHQEMNILDCDMLSLAVQLTMTIGFSWIDNEFVLSKNLSDLPLYRVPDGSVDELYIIHLTLLGHIFQTIASFPKDDEEAMEFNDDVKSAEKTKLSSLIVPFTKIDPRYSSMNLDELLLTVKKAIVSFLEPLAVLYNAITLVPPPDVLKHPEYHEYEALCRYMGLPTKLEDLLDGDFVLQLFNQWSAHLVPIKDELSKIVRQPIMPRPLVDLPTEFTDLLHYCTTYHCPSMKANDRYAATQPTMCLVCGTLMCSQAYCCQKMFNKESMGACNYHMRICSGDSNGMFLRIRECQVVLLSKKRGTYKPAPYVDEFGETDTGFRRGNPLHLQPEIYKKLQRLWMHQEVAEEVVNQYDMNHRNLNLDWHHF